MTLAAKPDWLLADFDLSSNNTFGLPARSRYAAIVTDEAQLAEIIAFASANALPVRVLGGGSNVVLNPSFDGLTLLIAIKGRTIVSDGDQQLLIEAKGGENWHEFVLWTIENHTPGLENLAGIPGTVGAAPVQNIGAYGVELADRFDSLTAFDTKTLAFRTFDLAECGFAYRNSVFKQDPGRFIVTAVRFALATVWRPNLTYTGLASALDEVERQNPRDIMNKVLAQRASKLPDPRQIGNAGSFFHNPVVAPGAYETIKAGHANAPAFPQPDGQIKLSAGWLIEQCGLKGKRLGNVGVSERHALVLVNNGDGTQGEILALANLIKAEVLQKFGVRLSEEPVFF